MTFYNIAVFGYLLLIFLFSMFFYRRIKKQSDFIVAGRSLPGYIVGGTLLATTMGSGSIIGGTNSLSFSEGIGVALIFASAAPMAAFCLYLLRSFIQNDKYESISDILEERYGEPARIVATLIIVVSFVGIVSYQFLGFGSLLRIMFGIDATTGALIGAAIIILSGFAGGLISIAYTDFMSVLMILVALVVGVPYSFIQLGGLETMQTTLPTENLTIFGNKKFIDALVYFLPLFLLILGDQNTFQRFFSVKDKKSLSFGVISWVIGLLIISPLIALGASTARAFTIINDQTINKGEAMIYLSMNHMPTIIGGISLAGIAGFVVTTGNSFLLSSSSSLTKDFLEKYFFKEISEAGRIRLQRFVLVMLGTLAIVMGLYFTEVLKLQMYAYTIYGVTITPALIFALFNKNLPKKSGVISMIAGATLTLFGEINGGILGYKPVIVAASTSTIILIIFSIISGGNKNDNEST